MLMFKFDDEVKESKKSKIKRSLPGDPRISRCKVSITSGLAQTKSNLNTKGVHHTLISVVRIRHG